MSNLTAYPGSTNNGSILNQRLRSIPESSNVSGGLMQANPNSDAMQFAGPGQMSADQMNQHHFMQQQQHQQQQHQQHQQSPSGQYGQPGQIYGFNPQAPPIPSSFPQTMRPDGQNTSSNLVGNSLLHTAPFHGPPPAQPLSPKPEHSKSPGPPLFAPLTKPPKGPDKPLIPYLRFSKSVWDRVKVDNPGLPFAEIGKVIGQQWRECSSEAKAKYTEDYLRDKEKYAQAQKAFLESPEYQEWQRTKNHHQQLEEEAEKAAKARADHHQQQQIQHAKQTASVSSAQLGRTPQQSQGAPGVAGGQPGGFAQLLQGPLEELQSMSQRMLPGKQNGNVAPFQAVQQPAEPDDDADDFVRAKHAAATRYRRNHKLMAETFSDSVVPDGKMIVNEHRITLLRKQVQSLAHHQDRLMADKKEMIDKHAAKKQKLMEDSEAFDKKWAAVKEECKPLTKEQFQASVDKYRKLLEERVAEYNAQQAAARNQHEELQKSLDAQPSVSSPRENTISAPQPSQELQISGMPQNQPGLDAHASPEPYPSSTTPAAPTPSSPLDALLLPAATVSYLNQSHNPSHPASLPPFTNAEKHSPNAQIRDGRASPSGTDLSLIEPLVVTAPPAGLDLPLQPPPAQEEAMQVDLVEPEKMEVDPVNSGPAAAVVEEEQIKLDSASVEPLTEQPAAPEPATTEIEEAASAGNELKEHIEDTTSLLTETVEPTATGSLNVAPNSPVTEPVVPLEVTDAGTFESETLPGSDEADGAAESEPAKPDTPTNDAKADDVVPLPVEPAVDVAVPAVVADEKVHPDAAEAGTPAVPDSDPAADLPAPVSEQAKVEDDCGGQGYADYGC